MAGAQPSLAAGPADSIHTPGITPGQFEVDLKLGRQDRRNAGRESGRQVGFGYGVRKHWFTQVTAEYSRLPDTGTGLEAIEWQNLILLTPPERYPFDVGFLTELDWLKERSDGYSLKVGPLFETKVQDLQLNFNVLFERQFGAESSMPTELEYQWQIRYAWKPAFHVGMQGFGELGEWDDWAPRSEQSHRVGPALFGEIGLGAGQRLQYNAAYLTDRSQRARSNGFRFQVQYKY